MTEIVFPFLISESLGETFIKTLVVGWPLFFLFKGHRWSLWVLTFLLALNAALYLYIAYELDLISLYAIGVFNVIFAVTIHFLKDIQFQEYKRTVATIALAEKYEKINYPYLLTRYWALLIDGLILTSLFGLTMVLVQNTDYRPIAFFVYLLIAIIYEPFMLAFYSATLGHKLFKIEVKSISDIERNITFFQGILRFFTKATLGWVSFITISFNSEKRAIHDFVGASIVIEKSD